MALSFEEEGHIYRLGKRVLPSVTTILKATGLYDEYKEIPQHFVVAAGLRGDAVHAAVHRFNETGMWSPDIHPDVEPHLAAYRQWAEETGFTCHHSELRLHCQTLFFAGTLDDVGDIYGEPGLLDIKSTRELNIEATRIQTAAYYWMYKRSGLEPQVGPDDRYALHLRPHMSPPYRLEQFEGTFDEDIVEFLNRYRKYMEREET